MERISVLVRQLVDAARMAGGALQGGPTPLAEAVEAALSLERSRQPRVAFIGRVPEGTQVQTGPDVLARILGALVANAAQAVPPERSGRVEVVAAKLAPDRVLVEVVDDGVGMPPEVLRRAFDPFFSTRPEVGAGLGLPVALALTEGLGGALTVESLPGVGTRVRLVLPAAAT
jgi:signal transduction histidine kinase